MNDGRPKFVELFAGVGGFRLGFERAGWQCVWANEIDKFACQVYRKQFGSIHEGDIRTVDLDTIPDHDILCAGFPCQAFSVAGKRKGFDDTRGTLFFEICRILQVKRPYAICLENVKGLLNHDDGETFRVILESLDELGYDVVWSVLNSKFFGVPQNRERVFIIGYSRTGSRPEVLSERKKYQQPKNIYRTPKENGERVPSQIPEPKRNSECFKGGRKRERRFDTGEKPMMLHNIYGGFGEDEPRVFTDISPTILTQGGAHLLVILQRPHGHNKGGAKELPCLRGSSMEHNDFLKHNTKIRKLTPRECERLQAFPDDWTKMGIDKNGKEVPISDTQRYKMMGNAVTVNVIEWIAGQV